MAPLFCYFSLQALPQRLRYLPFRWAGTFVWKTLVDCLSFPPNTLRHSPSFGLDTDVRLNHSFGIPLLFSFNVCQPLHRPANTLSTLIVQNMNFRKQSCILFETLV